ncbi:MBL fold metallo-hydrolase [Litorivicinus lipolyticus]|uniref:MBL fold metallo-hydrolase n=1 Tax=Litorivicinus lipolyticus TaxID=418701 RepID=A0A5Q2QA01_9GAMM|nr:MBL fold metallo-hydrolase [Litorivicinus lipolyticus]QGG81148.1 MBL fold metallo-hydrolase [Litorivicinus lipolyticus]
MSNPSVRGYFDPATWTVTYLVKDPDSHHCAIIDSVQDYDPASGRTNFEHADALIERVRSEGLSVDWILETHVHADHLSAAPHLKAALGGQVAIGANIDKVQSIFGPLFNAGPEFATDGRQFDKLLNEGDQIAIGGLTLTAMHTPGHTPACMSYLIGDAVFVGDTLFMPDFGTARCDFPGGDANTLWTSVEKLMALPASTRVFTGHDYAPGGREVAFESTVGEQKSSNIHLQQDQAAFVAMREARDASLAMPTLILPSVQTNMRAGELPPAEDNGVRYMKIPLNAV